MYTRPLYTHIVTLMNTHDHHQWCCKRNMSVCLCRRLRHSIKTTLAGIRLHWRTFLTCFVYIYILCTQCTHGRWVYTRLLYAHIVTLKNTYHQWCCKRNMSVCLYRVRRHSTETSPAGIRLHLRTLLKCLMCVYILCTQCTHGRWMHTRPLYTQSHEHSLTPPVML